MRTKLTDYASIPAVIENMTLEEKANLIIIPNACTTFPIEDLDIPSIILADGVTGINSTQIILDYLTELRNKILSGASENNGNYSGNIWMDMQKILMEDEEDAEAFVKNSPLLADFLEYLKKRRGPAKKFVSFPSGINIGATFNTEMAAKLGISLGEEMRACHVDVVLGPNVDIMRDPLGGRNYEMYGEDPVLVSEIGSSFVQGIQKTGTAACVKHFIANNQETGRQELNTHVSRRTLRELYARGFEHAVKKAGVRSVMSSYNAVNGTFASYNSELLTEWLKKEWGFDGIVVSDWGAASEHPEQSVAAGLDMVLHGEAPGNPDTIVQAVRDGKLDGAKVDQAVERILGLIVWLRENQRDYACSYSLEKILKTCYECIVDGAVLLKNDNCALPLKETAHAAFYGSKAKDMMECGSGSTFVTTSLHSNLTDECRKKGVSVYEENMDAADTVIYAAGAAGGENADRSEMNLDAEDKQQILAVLKEAKAKGKKTIVVLNISGPVDVSEWEVYADAILAVFVPGCMGGIAAADLLLGQAVPGGKLPVTFPMKYGDTPCCPNFPSKTGDVYYGEELFVGYRWYECRDMQVKYPFGYGLSYTDFELYDFEVAQSCNIQSEKKLKVSLKIKNTGEQTGSEVIQIYLTFCDTGLPRPEKELKAFTKVYLQPGESRTVMLDLDREDFEIYDSEKGRVIPRGTYYVHIGTSSRDIRKKCAVEILTDYDHREISEYLMEEVTNDPMIMKTIEQYIPDFGARIEKNRESIRQEKLGAVLNKYVIEFVPDALAAQNLQKIICQEIEKKKSENDKDESRKG